MKHFIRVMSVILALGLAGCGSEKAESTGTESSVIQGCDAFEDCESGSTSAASADFKTEYESVNGTKNDEGKENRTVSIPEDNPMVISSAEEIVQKTENKETFYVYFGDALCPWCRSVIETALSEAEKAGVKTIYDVDLWDSEGRELLRDTWEIQDNSAVKTKDGTEAYYTLLEKFDAVLEEYTLSDDAGREYDTGEKRIYAPNFIYIENGEPAELVSGISAQQTDSRQELSDEILKDEEEIFSSFFSR